MRGRTIHSVRPSISPHRSDARVSSAAAQEQIGGHDALAGGVVQRDVVDSRCDQSRTAVACSSAGASAPAEHLKQVAPGGRAVAHQALDAHALLLEVALEYQPDTAANSSSTATTVR